MITTGRETMTSSRADDSLPGLMLALIPVRDNRIPDSVRVSLSIGQCMGKQERRMEQEETERQTLCYLQFASSESSYFPQL